jgi:hypothetical protein
MLILVLKITFSWLYIHQVQDINYQRGIARLYAEITRFEKLFSKIILAQTHDL